MVGAYALDALSPEERERFERHLASCSQCREELTQLREVVGVLPLAIEPIEPSPTLKERLLAEAADTEGDRRLRAIPGGRPTPRPRPHLPLRQILAGAAAAAALVGLILWNVSLQQSVNATRSALAFQRQVANALAHGASVSRLTGVTSGAAAALVQPRGHHHAYLVVDGFPRIASSHVYELWLIPPHGAPVPSGVFRYSGNNVGVVPVTRAANTYQMAAVTVEPGPSGSKVPTGAKVVVGKVTT